MFSSPRLVHFLSRQIRNRCISSKVPDRPTWITVNHDRLPQVEEISRELVDHLERLSLVEFSNEEGLKRLSSAIKSANQLYMVNTDDVEPLDTVLENRTLFLRKDEITEGGCRDAILSNACRTEEEYFVAPPGNIPLKQEDKAYKEKLK
ncbi:glutamyl-tRNA(Gln) amidotransferase subunit C, mitochondrial-like isoform X2 [Pomacea canaliculata]|uniref:glutamyl-tRNA(Gln) amidotransferase subunit C, mitochondrial-like isoform X2 n=1 Tax=Pomacea canaliculata TaxID=400727 RepID=UPI000D7266ED|nr:glutamyl-tRNA(Gln) amidotransferase subunit C, mitochondrial-like isoform X2 [Pomacea canaliculata]